MSNAWFHTFNSQFWIIIGGMVCTFFSILAKSKCQRCSCCGVEVERNVRAELESERMRHAAAHPPHRNSNAFPPLFSRHTSADGEAMNQAAAQLERMERGTSL